MQNGCGSGHAEITHIIGTLKKQQHWATGSTGTSLEALKQTECQPTVNNLANRRHSAVGAQAVPRQCRQMPKHAQRCPWMTARQVHLIPGKGRLTTRQRLAGVSVFQIHPVCSIAHRRARFPAPCPSCRGVLKRGKKKKRKVFLYTIFPKRPRVAHMVNHGWWRLAVGGDWRLAVGNWRLVAASGGWRWLVVGDWWLVAVGSGWRWAVGRRWRLAAVGGWRLVAVGGWWLVVPWGSP